MCLLLLPSLSRKAEWGEGEGEAPLRDRALRLRGRVPDGDGIRAKSCKITPFAV